MPRRPKILVVEDYAPTRDLIEATLTGSFMRTVCVCDGRQALVYLASGRPDLVLTDFIMPNVDGLTLAHEIRRRADLRDLPIVFLTGADSLELQRECRAAGVAAVIAKPFSINDLVARLEQVLAGRPAADPFARDGWVYAPIGSAALPAAEPGVVDRLALPVRAEALPVGPIVKSRPVLVEAWPPEPRVTIARAPSSWDFMPAGAAIPEFAAVGRTALALPEELPGALAPRLASWLSAYRTLPSKRPRRSVWVPCQAGAAAIFAGESHDLGRSVEAALGRLEAA